MKFNPNIHNRRSIRLAEYDYSLAGAYFVTICTQGREYLFGEVVNGGMQLNDAGHMVQTVWGNLPERFAGIELDEFVTKPNHVHGIIVLIGAPLVGALGGGADGEKNHAKTRSWAGTRPAPTNARKQNMAAVKPAPALGEIVGVFKSITTHEYVLGIEQHGWPSFSGRLWHRNYYEHIIRNEKVLDNIRQYIAENPMRWEFDRENPAAQPDALQQNFWKEMA